MILDIKMDGAFTRKARLVADGHKTKPPASVTYSSAFSRDSVRIALIIASLNSLPATACDIGNAYLNATCREKLWTVAGPEFGSDKGAVMIIARVLYGLKSSGAAWRSALAETMRSLNYQPTQADPDVYIKRAVKQNGEPYYKLRLIYVDDVLNIAENPNSDFSKNDLVEMPLERSSCFMSATLIFLTFSISDPIFSDLVLSSLSFEVSDDLLFSLSSDFFTGCLPSARALVNASTSSFFSSMALVEIPNKSNSFFSSPILIFNISSFPSIDKNSLLILFKR